MGIDVSPIGSPNFHTPPDRTARDARRPAAPAEEDAVTLSSNAIPASPPPEVLDAIGLAGCVARELHEQGRELRFGGGEGDGERLRVELHDRDGNVVRRLAPSELLDVATGTPID